jgi:cytochrome c oxidase cbb3-type subunit 3
VNRVYVGMAAMLLGLAVIPLPGCDSLPGKPRPADRYVRPSQVASFDVLYGHQCAGCHGADGTHGAARPLNDPLYLAVVSDDDLRQVITNGVGGKSMPASAESAGGRLTAAQIDVIVRGVRQRWGDPQRFSGTRLPAYRGAAPGDPARGARAYVTFCARCHGDGGAGGADAGSVVDGAYLALVSDQSLRTTVIAGRPDLDKPDYRENVPGRPMTSQEIDDVVAWLRSHREEFPGQPYPARAGRILSREEMARRGAQ